MKVLFHHSDKTFDLRYLSHIFGLLVLLQPRVRAREIGFGRGSTWHRPHHVGRRT